MDAGEERDPWSGEGEEGKGKRGGGRGEGDEGRGMRVGG